jgi:acyl carrier protein
MNKPTVQRIRNYLEESFLAEDQLVALRDDDDLLSALDSLQVLRMLMDLETEYSIHVDPTEFTPENLGSIERLINFLGKKLGEAVC